ncbi:MAG: hypothetical protein ACLR6A_00995 [Candidatus Gastranaerophilaceae bacterium]
MQYAGYKAEVYQDVLTDLISLITLVAGIVICVSWIVFKWKISETMKLNISLIKVVRMRICMHRTEGNKKQDGFHDV